MSNTTSGSESFIEDIHRPSDGAGLRHMKWIQKAVHLLFIQQVFLQNQIPDGGTGLYGLLSNIGSFLIADIRADGCNNAHTVFNQIAAACLICRNACNTVFHKSMHRIGQRIN